MDHVVLDLELETDGVARSCATDDDDDGSGLRVLPRQRLELAEVGVDEAIVPGAVCDLDHELALRLPPPPRAPDDVEARQAVVALDAVRWDEVLVPSELPLDAPAAIDPPLPAPEPVDLTAAPPPAPVPVSVAFDDSEPGVEARVPTRLVEGPARAKPHDGRYAGYALVRELVRAPGAVLAEGRDAIGVPWLLQLVRTRPVADDAERVARQHLEHVLAARTAELLDEPALGLRAHGVVDEQDGSRTLFWVLPWHPRAPRLAADFAPRPPVDVVVRTGLMLALRLVARHARGRTEPLLTHALLAYGDETTQPALLGFPLLVPPVAAADGMPAPLLAPEERLHAQPTASGDLWRLGEVLRRLVDACGDEARALEPLVSRLSEPDPSRRVPRASQVLAELEALSAGRVEPAGTTQFSALDPTALSSLLLSATADSTTLEAAQVAPGTGVVVATPDEERRPPARWSPDVSLELALDAVASTPPPPVAQAVELPRRATPLPASAASVALAPFAVDLTAQGGDTVCEVPTRLRAEPSEDEPIIRTIVRTRTRPVVERSSGEVRAPILDRTRSTPEPVIARPSVLGADETVRITIPRSAVVLRAEVQVEVGAPIDDEPSPPARSPLTKVLRSTPRYLVVLTATAFVALALGVALGLMFPR